jgi:hypothetical protein
MLTSNKRLRIDHLIHMSEEAAPPLTLDDLMEAACDLLDLCRSRGLDIVAEKIMIERAMSDGNAARLEKHIARVEARLRDFDAASVGASSASQGSAAIVSYTSSVAESQNRIQTHNADLPSLATLPAIPCNSGIPTLPAIPENQGAGGVQNHEFNL